MARNIEAARARAEAMFKKVQPDLLSGSASRSSRTEDIAAQEKTARLRALRLAKESEAGGRRAPARL